MTDYERIMYCDIQAGYFRVGIPKKLEDDFLKVFPHARKERINGLFGSRDTWLLPTCDLRAYGMWSAKSVTEVV